MLVGLELIRGAEPRDEAPTRESQGAGCQALPPRDLGATGRQGFESRVLWSSLLGAGMEAERNRAAEGGGRLEGACSCPVHSHTEDARRTCVVVMS